MIENAYCDITAKWLQDRRTNDDGKRDVKILAAILGIMHGIGCKVTRGKRGWYVRGYAKNPKTFEPLIWFFSEYFPPTINSATKEKAKSGGNVYFHAKNKTYIWHLSGQAKIQYIMNKMGLKFEKKKVALFPEDCCQYCGGEEGHHEQECGTLQT